MRDEICIIHPQDKIKNKPATTAQATTEKGT